MSIVTERLDYIDKQGGVTASQLAEKFNISVEVARVTLSRLVKSGRVWVQKGARRDYALHDRRDSIYRVGQRPESMSRYIDGRDKWADYEPPVHKKPISHGWHVNVMYIQYVNARGAVTPSELAAKFSISLQHARTWLSRNAKLGRLHCIKGDKTRIGHAPEENKYSIKAGEAMDAIASAFI